MTMAPRPLRISARSSCMSASATASMRALARMRTASTPSDPLGVRIATDRERGRGSATGSAKVAAMHQWLARAGVLRNAGQHSTELGERLSDGQPTAVDATFSNRVLMRSAALLDHRDRTAHRALKLE